MMLIGVLGFRLFRSLPPSFAARAFGLWMVAKVLPWAVGRVCGSRWDAPLDFGVRLRDGRRLLGSHKTWRSVTAAVAGCAIAAELLHLQLQWAEHVVILFPLWKGSMPALLKGFLEQTLRPGFAFAESESHGLPKRLLSGRSARIIVTMGMPALFYRWYFRAHSLKSLQRNILRFCGFRPVHACVVGMVDDMGQKGRGEWLAKVQQLGIRGK